MFLNTGLASSHFAVCVPLCQLQQPWGLPWERMISFTMEMMYKCIKAYPPTHDDVHSDPQPVYSSIFTRQQLITGVLLHCNTTSKAIPGSHTHTHRQRLCDRAACDCCYCIYEIISQIMESVYMTDSQYEVGSCKMWNRVKLINWQKMKFDNWH